MIIVELVALVVRLSLLVVLSKLPGQVAQVEMEDHLTGDSTKEVAAAEVLHILLLQVTQVLVPIVVLVELVELVLDQVDEELTLMALRMLF